MKTNVYVDAFNLYYGCLKDTPYRWLDLAALCRAELPQNTIQHIRYFTARVRARPNDPQQPDRQQAYLRALGTIPDLTVHFGHYLETTPRMPLAHPVPGMPATVQVRKSEEKGSDVNLASYLLLDAFDQKYEVAIVISNDSDLAEPIRLVRQRFGVRVLVLHPCRRPNPNLPSRDPRQPAPPSIVLKKVATKSWLVAEASLAASQFPVQLVDATGTITKPSSW
jgi:uncharacterized LabA/DUF88 family protein